MFSLFPIHRARVGISFRAKALELVEVRRGWNQLPTVTRLVTRPLPAGLLAPTATILNVSDPAVLVKELRVLLQGVRDRAVAIDLPMASGALALHHFETLPSVRAEQEALLRWRLRQDEHLTVPDLKILWQVFPAVEPGSTAVSVLLVGIRQTILDQYQRVCEAADLMPLLIGCSTLHLLDLARSTLPPPYEEAYVAHRTAEALIVLAFRRGRPRSLRVKPMRRGDIDVKTELMQTLLYFAQECPPLHQAARSTPLFMVDEERSALGVGRQDQREVWTLSDDPTWTLPVYQATWATVPIVSTVTSPVQPPFATLASVLAA